MSTLRGQHLGSTRPPVSAAVVANRLKIFTHVFQFKTPARVMLLTFLLCNETRFRELARKHPVEIEGVVTATGDYFRAVLCNGDSEGFTFEGWVDALWASL